MRLKSFVKGLDHRTRNFPKSSSRYHSSRSKCLLSFSSVSKECINVYLPFLCCSTSDSIPTHSNVYLPAAVLLFSSCLCLTLLCSVCSRVSTNLACLLIYLLYQSLPPYLLSTSTKVGTYLPISVDGTYLV